MKKPNKKTLALTIVAFVLVLMSLISFTFSWIDDIKLVEFQNDDLAKNGAPLKTGTDINASVTINKTDNTIDLGNMLQTGDISFQYNNGNPQQYSEEDATSPTAATQHIKYDTDPTNPIKNPNRDDINEKKGYFYESGDMHLSGCYSDGETFYFQRQGGSTGYREGNKDDENVNYISFTTKVSSPDANVDFWFRNEPAIYQSGTNTKITQARYAIIVDGKCHIYSSDGNANTISNNTVTSINNITRRASDYTYGHDNNTTEERGKNSNTLFSIKKGDTVNMTIKIWLESGFNANNANITASDINVQLVSSWAYSRTIKIVDKTTTNTKNSWLNDNNAKLYFTCPAVLNEYAKEIYNTATPSVQNWSVIPYTGGYEHAPFYYLNNVHSTEDGYNVYTITVPMVYNSEEMIIYRCNSAGWNKGTHSGKTGDYGVHYWNWWESTIPSTYVTGVYTLYGGSHDEYAGRVVTDDSKKETYLGYGTWGPTEQLTVHQIYQGVNWAKFSANSDNVYIRDYSDFDTSGETYVHTMHWNSSDSTWTATIPKSSALLQFLFTQNSVIKGRYGYHSYENYDGNGHFNPQMRPEDSTSYQFTFKNDKNNNVNGMGYWSNANHIYLIKNGNMASQSTIDSYLFYKFNNNGEQTFENHAFPGVAMSLLSGVKYQGNYDVYQSKELDNCDPDNEANKNIYPDRRKSNESNTANMISVDTTVIFNNHDNGIQSADTLVFPGCYFDYANNVWIGSLTGTARSGIVTGEDAGGDDSGSGSDSGGGTISGYTIDSSFVFKIGSTPYTVYQNSAGNSFKVRLPLNSGDNWITVLKSSKNYGLDSSSKYTVPKDNLNLSLVKDRNQNFAFTASSSGNYIATFEYDNGNTNTIRITSVLAES